ncbi:protein of unknown function [Taphrina deformans PYCC 5710]|uniref:Transcription factor domain-containing protein n=1 Tax=Taphrina deformans (strain PYCC 5710 / ATCC 11124 / CBS 356.35 / IMI 108563 / JCM 9778 / NBRC 8474) TaxID=1097556 RepID=R4XB10_TAPDE|nr:protein of unknown function [Taphrina deformans PYCC 5710]|eukprot:CCG82764.1 protein of unknown function [Taphrina deformans PYCC 5710]
MEAFDSVQENQGRRLDNLYWPSYWQDGAFAEYDHDIQPPDLLTTTEQSSDPSLYYDSPVMPSFSNTITDKHLNTNLLRAFSDAIDLVPSLTFETEDVVWRDINASPMIWRSATEAMLCFAASYLHLTTQDPTYAARAIVHRGLALQSLQTDLSHGCEGVDAAIASSILLCDQAALEGDWQSNILHHRGLANLCDHHLRQSSSSVFAKTRTLRPPNSVMQRRRVNIERICATPDSMGCYNSLERLKRFLSDSSSNLDVKSTEFLGKDKKTKDAKTRQIQYFRGGVGHLLILACDIHEIQAEVYQRALTVNDSSAISEVNHAIVQSQAEGEYWLAYLPQSIVSDALASDPPALLLLAYKYALDILLYRCSHLMRQGRPTFPAPNVILAISYIQHCYQEITIKNNPKYDAAESQLFNDCMIWPLWVLNWAKSYTDTNMDLAAVATTQGLALQSHVAESYLRT